MKSALYLATTFLVLASACAPPEDAPETVPTPPVEQDETAESPAPASDEQAAQDAPESSCLSEVGEAASAELVDQCIMMSPATHPPCNAQNSCQRIREEIARGCNFGDRSGNPEFCTEYEE